MKTIVEVDNKQYVRDVIVYNTETQEPLVVTDSTPLLYLQRRGFKNIKTKEVPETWEELKELCKDNNKLGVGLEFIEFNEFSMVFKREGIICFRGDNEIITVNRTPAQMWQIIKSLIGEE